MGSVGRSIQTITSNPKIATAVERAFRKANLQGEDTDLYGVISSYKTLQNLPENDKDIIYDYLSERLGFTR